MDIDLKNHILKSLKKENGILGVLIAGSIVDGSFDKFSDFDVVVFVEENFNFRRAQLIYAKKKVDIIYITIQNAVSRLEEEKKDMVKSFSGMLAEGEFVFLKNKTLTKLPLIAKKNLLAKRKVSKKDLIMHRYFIEDYLSEAERAASKNDFFYFNTSAEHLIEYAISLFLLTNGFISPKPKNKSSFLKSKNKTLYNLLNSFYKTNDLVKKLEKLKAISAYSIKNINLPVEWKI